MLEDWIEQGSSFTKFPVFASAFDLLLQRNNASLEILNLLFFFYFLLSIGMTGACSFQSNVFSLVELQNATLWSDKAWPCTTYVCDYASYGFCDAVQYLYETFFKTNIPKIELGELHQIHRYSYMQSLYSMLRFRQGHLNEALMITKGTWPSRLMGKLIE